MSPTPTAPASQSYNVPKPQITEHEFESPPALKNPALRGLALSAAAAIVKSAPFISSYLWRNAGFDTISRVPGLDRFPPRFDPTVVPRLGDASVQASPVPLDRLEPRLANGSASRRYLSIPDLHAAYRAGSLSPSQVVESLLPLIDRNAHDPAPDSVSFIQVIPDRVREAAEASSKRWQQGSPIGHFDGVPIAVKDDVDVEGYDTRLGSKFSFTKPGTAWCVEKLVDAGAIIMGKTLMHELGTDIAGNNPIDGTPLNPHNDGHYCGGSSTGSTYAVSVGLVPFAVGADAGGSIRIPASLCGIYALKPSHNRVSRSPTPNGASSNGVTGPMAANMVDLDLGFRLMATPDPSCPQSSLFPAPFSQTSPRESRPKTLGVFRSWIDLADAPARDACFNAIDVLHNERGYEIVDISIPFTHEGQLAQSLTALSELSANTTAIPLSEITPSSQLLICVGRQTPAADFILAQRFRELLMRHLSALFKQHPGLIIITPTTAVPGWPIHTKVELKSGLTDANASWRNAEYTWVANFSGCPSLTAPAGYVQVNGGGNEVPVGVMGLAQWGGDEDLIEFGYDVEHVLSEALPDSRKMPKNWVDILKRSEDLRGE
ncbi:glutamyl-tRNA amidotransferase subunit A [Xylariaceae sp. FL1272]|nr:glutamyl-tRNA amidotransferase subunit A [Xylariaceae sp. FL1272]